MEPGTMTRQEPERRDSVRAVGEIVRLAQEAGSNLIAQDAVDLATRVQEGRFFVACLGQFKRGKSSLLNALVQDPVLPVGVAPVTSAVTVLRHGEERKAIVRFADGRRTEVEPEAISRFVTEERNPRNAKRVAGVEVHLPSPLLAGGLCLVDTPGIGSAFAWNSDVTREFVPQLDGALVVLGADPPISGDELALVEEVSREVQDLVFVLNKADRLPDGDLADAAAFTSRLLAERLGRPAPDSLRVSAIERLEGRVTRDWALLTEKLADFSTQKRIALVAAAGSRGLRRLAARLTHFLDEQVGALQRPVEETEARVRALEQWLADAELSLRQLKHLFDSEESWVEGQLTERSREWLEGASVIATAELRDMILSDRERRGMGLRPWACEAAERLSYRIVRGWLDREQERVEAIYRKSAGRFVELANELLARLARSATDGAAPGFEPLPPEAGFRERSRFYHTSMLHRAPMTELRRLRDLVLPSAVARNLCLRDVRNYLLYLLEINGSRAKNDLRDRVHESRCSIEAEIRSQMQDSREAATRVLEMARIRKDAGAAAIQEEWIRLAALRHQVVAVARESS